MRETQFWKDVTRRSYENHADEYMAQTADYWEKFPDAKRIFDRFVDLLQGRLILDVGSGGGRDSALFQEYGFNPIALDLSRKMVMIAHKRGLRAIVMDFEHLGFTDSCADGIWAYTSLLHLPQNHFASVIQEFYRILSPLSPLLISMKEGVGEEYKESLQRWGGDVRYFAFWSEDDLMDVLTRAGFHIVEVRRPVDNIIDILAVK